MLNQHLAMGTEGMELEGLWDRWWLPRRDTGATGVTQQCLTEEGEIPMAGKPSIPSQSAAPGPAPAQDPSDVTLGMPQEGQNPLIPLT